ncbi:MAG: heme ABC transporter ATP-binding protein [Deltaproteobacteria bacterium]|nr:MAG: heme ABC transporter ATP-binding protein [Deltaproteobacteria bacterium]
MSLIDIQGISLQYDSLPVIKRVSVQVEQGEFFVIIGPNGAGKTSLLKALSGLHPLAEGDIQIRQRSIGDYSRKELARTLALVPQQINADFPFTVAETVLMGRYPHLGLLAVEGKKDLQLAEQAMEFTEINHLAGRRLGQLSGGERQRVIIARAICQQSKILLLDEPTASLDPAHQLRIMDLMERLRHREQITIVMVSHDLNLASSYADRLLLLKDGEVEKIGTPWQVLTREQLSQSYGCTLLVDENPQLGTPRVSLVSEKVAAKISSEEDACEQKQ